jgi:hypothetical protein
MAGKSKSKAGTCKQNKMAIGGMEMRLFVIVVTAQAQGPALNYLHMVRRPK